MQETQVFQYLDYRHFLNDFYQAKKQENPSFSHRVFAKKAGFVSPSLLLLVMQGKRNITQKSLPGFCKALDLNVRERKYFETMVLFNQSSNPEAKKHYYEQLVPIYKKEHGQHLKANQYDYLSNWYGPVIREMIELPDFREDPKWISRKLKNLVSPTDVKKMLDLLIELNLVERNDLGTLNIIDTNITTPDEVFDVASFQFHQQMLSLAKRSLVEDQGHKREISGITAALSENQFEKIKQYIQEFQNKLMFELEQPDENQKHVYQFNCQLFPITKFDKDEVHNA
jgi:uncharacterized protein (TIGR02147 family)